MSASKVLQSLYQLDISSHHTPGLLHSLFQYDQEEGYLFKLQGSELTRFVDFLDEVRTLPPAVLLVTKQTLQAIDAIPSTGDIPRQCIRKLQAICEHHTILPTSCTISGALAKIGDLVAFGGFADVWEGIHACRKVCIKCLRVSPDGDKTKVRVRRQHVFFVPVEGNLRAP